MPPIAHSRNNSDLSSSTTNTSTTTTATTTTIKASSSYSLVLQQQQANIINDAPPPPPTTTAVPEFSRATIAEHNKADDCWLVIDNKVYDVTSWSSEHPGGAHVMHSFGGTDVTDSFRNTHATSAVAFQRLQALYIGKVQASSIEPLDPLTVEQRELAKKLQRDGMYRTSYLWYAWVIFRSLMCLVASIVLVEMAAGRVWMEFVGAMCLGLFFQQLAFVGHDAGHNSISHVRRTDRMIGIVVGNALTGVSISWWKATHNTHHVLTNSCDFDPDIQHLPVFAVSCKMMRSLYSHYHCKVMRFDRVSRWLVSIQHYTFWPVMGLARFNLYLQSWLFVLLKNTEQNDLRMMEVAALFFFWGWLSVLLSHCSSPILFLLVSHGLAGILHIQICVSHFPMETYIGRDFPTSFATTHPPASSLGDSSSSTSTTTSTTFTTAATAATAINSTPICIPSSSSSTAAAAAAAAAAVSGNQEHFFRRQLATTLNFDTSFWNGWFHGGLEYQIEHHLFPRLPRHNLCKVSPAVRALCARHGIEYKSISFTDAVLLTVQSLKMVATQAASTHENMLWKGLNAFG